MDNQNLDEAISRIGRSTRKDAPASLERNVLRKVRLCEGKTEQNAGLVDLIHRHLFSSGLFVPAAALAIVFSAFVSTVAISKEDSLQIKATYALGFDAITEAPRSYLDAFGK